MTANRLTPEQAGILHHAYFSHSFIESVKKGNAKLKLKCAV